MLLDALTKNLVWSIKTTKKEVFLTFDDGPIPEVTPWVLETLKQYDAKATFFCVGDNVKKHPDIYRMIVDQGHKVGNHTMNHLNGWTNFNKTYFENIEKCNALIHSNLFRPPYGKIKPSQISHLKNDYRIIMWDVLTKDYDASVTGEYCFEKVKKNCKPGSIIVFHDSIKAEKRLRKALPKSLEYLKQEGYTFSSIQ
ncbi:MAG TPA: polysaccharide deacetylase family protein [Bacteroidia bacterium]|jgi:peptidoglycan/xylan/chitin deacetylase (PgdA/CDA1 family)|nr:polysaccharide deacetylase family protein [Bacteroidota bacterium]MBP9789620.1 polysaccharide deacetylase family protein [Bacteroidia bacterium]MBK7431418.1 polysaccharide deacetylase family protein [Bacteroidota bacterium]MBK7571821.1 polysaccharide deacetylase family protein [Bacteroidota bacterium]MBK8586558.1 polysaccharide deacetylase family protein [Bacteroidota bacterium]